LTAPVLPRSGFTAATLPALFSDPLAGKILFLYHPFIMAEKNANAKSIFTLSAVILLLGIALAAFFLVQQPPGENVQPAREQAETRPAAETPAETGSGNSPLLLVLIFIVIFAAVTRIGRLIAKGKFKNGNGSWRS
jgi:hypothetical protein